MNHTALSQGLVLGVNFRRRADPALTTLRALTANGDIGDVLSVAIMNTGLLPTPHHTWRLAQPAGGVLLDRALHSFDMLRFLLRDEVADVSAAAAPPLLGDVVEEDVRTTVALRRLGIVAASHDSFVVPHAVTGVEVHGSRGTLVARHCWVDEPASELWLLRHGNSQAVPLPAADGPLEVVQRFVDAVRRRTAPLAGGTDGVAALAVVLTVAESIRRGQRLPVGTLPRTLVDRSVL